MKYLIIIILPLLSFGQNFVKLSESSQLMSSVGKHGLDTTKCEQNLSIYTEFYKQKSYKSSQEAWLYLFQYAPKRTKNIYIHGSNMYKHFIKNEQDSLSKESLIDDLLTIYDHRNYYF